MEQERGHQVDQHLYKIHHTSFDGSRTGSDHGMSQGVVDDNKAVKSHGQKCRRSREGKSMWEHLHNAGIQADDPGIELHTPDVAVREEIVMPCQWWKAQKRNSTWLMKAVVSHHHIQDSPLPQKGDLTEGGKRDGKPDWKASSPGTLVRKKVAEVQLSMDSMVDCIRRCCPSVNSCNDTFH